MKRLHFQNTFQHLPPILFERVEVTPLKDPKLMALSSSCERDMGWNQFDISHDRLAKWLNGTLRFEGDQQIATRYAGHQFGVWAGQLGDGRAISLGEYISESEAVEGHKKSQRWEIQVKGSGMTPFSRMGDGKAVIRSSVREFLCSEAMHALHIPTTRALALITGQDQVQRETVERSALVARVFSTNLRFGHFEYCFHYKQSQALKELAEYALKYFYTELNSIEEMLEQVVTGTADLMAHWMSVGFCHGVMNTDNMSFLGLTIDYGPFGFMEDTNLQYICNHSDPQGRYAYDQQPRVALWNLERLFICFSDLVEHKELQRIFDLYIPQYKKAHLNIFRKKLGLELEHEDDEALIEELLLVMHKNKFDFTYFFRKLCDFDLENFEFEGEGLSDWMAKYQLRLAGESRGKVESQAKIESYEKAESKLKSERQVRMKKINPKYILRNYIAQEIIEEIEKDKTEKIKQWLEILAHPFDEHPLFERYSLPTPAQFKDIELSCSS